jgi:hypothetical protein
MASPFMGLVEWFFYFYGGVRGDLGVARLFCSGETEWTLRRNAGIAIAVLVICSSAPRPFNPRGTCDIALVRTGKNIFEKKSHERIPPGILTEFLRPTDELLWIGVVCR